MVRSTLFLCVLSAWALHDSIADTAVCPDVCQLAARDGARTKGVLARRRAARVNRNARAAQSFPGDRPASATPAQSDATAILEATPTAAPYLPREATEVWPQASALFPAE